jgi:hypothetical protein
MSTTENTAIIQTENPDLLRDTNSKGLLFNNQSELKKYQARKNYMKSVKDKTDSYENRLSNMENQIDDIKNLLLQLLKKEE